MASSAQRACCEALANAILDGRYDAAPEFWDRQSAGCVRCRQRLEGYELLRRLVALSGGDSTSERDPSPQEGRQAVRVLEGRYARFKRNRRLAVGAVLLCIVGVGGALVFSRSDPEEPRVVHRGPVARATRLLESLRSGAGVLDASRLDASQSLADEFALALQDPESAVRSAGALGLALAGRSDSIPRLGATLRELALAPDAVRRQYGDQAGGLSGTLAANRTTALSALLLAASRPRTAPDPDLTPALMDLVRDPDRAVRESALVALAQQADLVPGETLWSLLRDDAEPNVRHLAACILLKSGDEAHERLAVGFLERPDARLEAGVLGWLEPSEAARRLARNRLESPSSDVGVLLAASALLARAGEAFDRGPVLRRSLASLDASQHLELARLARLGNWREVRGALQGIWRAARGVERLNLGGALVNWDVDSGSTLELAFEILGDEHNLACDDALDRLQGHLDPATRQRAAAIAARWRAGK